MGLPGHARQLRLPRLGRARRPGTGSAAGSAAPCQALRGQHRQREHRNRPWHPVAVSGRGDNRAASGGRVNKHCGGRGGGARKPGVFERSG
eukprot:11759174-Alexandrium_andersonii.AAC.1